MVSCTIVNRYSSQVENLMAVNIIRINWHKFINLSPPNNNEAIILLNFAFYFFCAINSNLGYTRIFIQQMHSIKRKFKNK